ncbi:hypothetical protein [Phocaeicola sp.]
MDDEGSGFGCLVLVVIVVLAMLLGKCVGLPNNRIDSARRAYVEKGISTEYINIFDNYNSVQLWLGSPRLN